MTQGVHLTERAGKNPEAADDDRYQRAVVLHPSGQMSVPISAVMAHPKFRRQLEALKRIRQRLGR